MRSMKRQKDRTLKDKLPRSVGAQYATGEVWRNNSKKKKKKKRWSQTKTMPSCGCDGMEIKSDAIKSNVA